MIQKSGHLFCAAYLEFVRDLPCYFCNRAPKSEPHHHPSKGRGVTRDDRTVPVCRECHERCHGITAGGKEIIPAEHQRLAVEMVRGAFLERSSDAQAEAFLESRRSWRQRRMTI